VKLHSVQRRRRRTRRSSRAQRPHGWKDTCKWSTGPLSVLGTAINSPALLQGPDSSPHGMICRSRSCPRLRCPSACRCLSRRCASDRITLRIRFFRNWLVVAGGCWCPKFLLREIRGAAVRERTLVSDLEICTYECLNKWTPYNSHLFFEEVCLDTNLTMIRWILRPLEWVGTVNAVSRQRRRSP
jgi:hypothetical protein